MQKKIQFPRRAQSLNIYKPPKSLQLPRFHSRPKNNIIALNKNSNVIQAEPANGGGELRNSTKLTKNQMAEIVSKIKQKKFATKSKQKKPISEKKITAFNKLDVENDQKQKLNKRANPNNLQIKGQYIKEDLTCRQVSSNNQRRINFNQFRSKSLKNAVKLQEPINRQNDNRYHEKRIKLEIKKKNCTEQAVQVKNRVKPDSKSKVKNQIIHQTQITTQATQPNILNISCQIDKKIWKKIVEIFENIIDQPDNLDWPQQYIVMDKQVAEKKLYQMLQQTSNNFNTNNPNIKSKIRKHICITRVIIYLHSSLILHNTETKTLLPIFNKIHETFVIINDIVSNGVGVLSSQRSSIITRNNQFSTKILLKILSKRTIPHQCLLKNMLQSSLKIQSIQFIQILDKTLKCYPYLPPPSKQLYLVLDLDETLIHYDYNTELFHVRPFAEQFLKKASALFEITIFTAALQQYADQILDQIDRQHCISYKLYRNHLTYIEGVPLKDLSMLGRPLNRTIIVDNIAGNYRLQPENGIQIRSWYDDDNDQALGKLYGFLLKIAQDYREDVRVAIREFNQFIKEEITRAEVIYELQHQL